MAVLLIAAGGYFWDKMPSKAEVLEQLKVAAQRQDYEAFAANLKIAYDKNWIADVREVNEAGQKLNDFILVERDLYVKETEAFHKGEVDHTLRISTIIHKAVPQSWRFRFLRMRSIEKFGKDAMNTGDLIKAEDYAKQLLAIMYTKEAANLLADIYIKKIEQNIAEKNKEEAEKNLRFITSGYELSQDRIDRINQLKLEIEKL